MVQLLIPPSAYRSRCLMCGALFVAPKAMETHVERCLVKHRDDIQADHAERQAVRASNVFTGGLDPELDKWLRDRDDRSDG